MNPLLFCHLQGHLWHYFNLIVFADKQSDNSLLFYDVVSRFVTALKTGDNSTRAVKRYRSDKRIT